MWEVCEVELCKEGDLMYEDFFPTRLAQLRNKRGVSARDMSLSLGQSENYINMIENKKSYPSMTVFFYICEYLQMSPKDFFDEDNENPQILNEITGHLKKLDAKTMESIADIVTKLGAKR